MTNVEILKRGKVKIEHNGNRRAFDVCTHIEGSGFQNRFSYLIKLCYAPSSFRIRDVIATCSLKTAKDKVAK